jgi:uncharacterized protein (DUF433 family)
MTPATSISIDPDVQGGTPCFSGTRVPIHSLFSALKKGRSIEEFLRQFPAVQRAQIEIVLDRADEFLTTGHAA